MIKRTRLKEIIFEADTPAGKAFDVLLIISVLISVTAVMLESIATIEARYGAILRFIEWFFTILFCIEYFLRIYAVDKSARYIFSFFGIVDLLSFLPTYISIFITGSQFFIIIRVLRVLRIFRVLKLVTYISETNLLLEALKASRRRILIFLLAVLAMVVILGAMMYIIEDAESGFTSIPRSIYWAIVTLTTVGYGDISPKTNLGQTLAALIMILGYSLIVVPTGFVSVAMSTSVKDKKEGKTCPQCSKEEHDNDALFCKYCGGKL